MLQETRQKTSAGVAESSALDKNTESYGFVFLSQTLR
jgi:hypothetical protein